MVSRWGSGGARRIMSASLGDQERLAR